jgi:NADH-quinone oxidoreductase subunit C
MNFEAIKDLLISKLGSDVIVKEETSGLQHALLIHPDRIAEVCLELRDNPNTYYDLLECLSGVDYGIEENMFGVVYHLASIPFKKQLTLKVVKYHDRSREELPMFPSVTSVWRTAEWHEREAYDLLGIAFANHPDLRRVLLPDDWEGYPLRKDYKAQEYYRGIKV